MPMVPVRCWRSIFARRLMVYPSCWIDCCTRARVSVLTSSGWLMALLTVWADTPAWAATWANVTAIAGFLLGFIARYGLRTVVLDRSK